jgi:hypothetical protein
LAIIKRAVGGFKLAFRLDHPGRNVAVYPDDTFIVSYPKSGNTWTRFLVANLVYPEIQANFGNIETLIPDSVALSRRDLARARRPRIIKSHEYFNPSWPRTINIVRDPRDVAVSQFHFHRKRKLIGDNYPIEKFVTRFIEGGTVAPFVYGSWGENVGSWLAARYGHPGFLLVRYEDMVSHPERELARVASFLNIDPEPERISQAVARSSADQMRKLEKAQAHVWSLTKETRKDIPFVRSAKSGGWQSVLSPDSVAEIETAWGSLMRWLGYELSSTVGDNATSRFHESILRASAR